MNDTDSIYLWVGLFTVIICVGGIRMKDSEGNTRPFVLLALGLALAFVAAAMIVMLLRR